MSNCCNQPKYYTYTEFVLKSQNMSTLIGDNFAIKLVFDEIDSNGQKVQFGKLVITSVFENIGKHEYSIITDVSHHLSDKETSKNTVTHSIAILSADDLKKNPVDIIGEKLFNKAVTANLLETNKNIKDNLYQSNKGDTFSLKIYTNPILSKKYDKQAKPPSGLQAAGVCTSSSSACGNKFWSKKSCTDRCKDVNGTCKLTRYSSEYKCNCNICGKKYSNSQDCKDNCKDVNGRCTLTANNSYSCSCLCGNVYDNVTDCNDKCKNILGKPKARCRLGELRDPNKAVCSCDPPGPPPTCITKPYDSINSCNDNCNGKCVTTRNGSISCTCNFG